MYTQNHINNWNIDHIKIMIPSFAVEGTDAEKIWLTFLWMVGQVHGFDKPFAFHYNDYQLLTDFHYTKTSAHVIEEFNDKYRQWIVMGYISNHNCIIEFRDHNWTFTDYYLKDIRLQRCWIQLYNAVWSGQDPRQDLFETKDNRWMMNVQISNDTGWFISQGLYEANADRKHVMPTDYVPSYLKAPKAGYGKSRFFAGKVIEQDERTTGDN